MSDVQSRVGLGFQSSGAATVRSDIASIYKALREGKKSVKEANSDLRELTSGIYTQQRAIAALGSSYRDQHVILFEAARSMRNIGSVGRTLLSMYSTYTLQQLRLGDATRSVTEIERELSRVTEEYARIVHDLGPENVYAQQLLAEMTALTNQHTRAVEGLSDAQREGNFMWASMALTVPGAASNLIYLNQHLSTLRLLLSDSTIRAAALASTFSTLATIITTAGAALIAYGVIDALVFKTAEERAQQTYSNLLGTSGYGISNIGGGMGFTPEGMESDLPGGSGLRDIYMGDTPMDEGLIERYVAPKSGSAGTLDEALSRAETIRETVVFNQNVSIRSADDKTTVDKVADATWRIIGEAVRR